MDLNNLSADKLLQERHQLIERIKLIDKGIRNKLSKAGFSGLTPVDSMPTKEKGVLRREERQLKFFSAIKVHANEKGEISCGHVAKIFDEIFPASTTKNSDLGHFLRLGWLTKRGIKKGTIYIISR